MIFGYNEFGLKQPDSSGSGRQLIVNNLHRDLKSIRRKAKVGKFTFHNLRRSYLTNMARSLPVHVVQKIAGYGYVKMTQQYYLAVQEDDLEKDRKVQSAILKGDSTDQLLTNSAPNKDISGPSAGRQKTHKALNLRNLHLMGPQGFEPWTKGL
ncbi:MAG: tyrosine-type recombinase/integrase [Deltaproteobacteria bacterium]|nr:tyrosine-type recombinase/integrase [Deltaproteobacteria bacterium]